MHNYILGMMSLVLVICIGSTSRCNYMLYKQHLQDRVNACLISFGLPPVPTLAMMKHLQAVLSGSCALAILEPGHFKPRDLDIYVPKGKLEDVVSFLLGVGMFYEIFDRKATSTSLSYMGTRSSGERVVCYSG